MPNQNLGRKVGNKNKVQKSQWKKWSNHAQRIFNDVYHAMRPSMQTTLTHPMAPVLTRDYWHTLRWNAAWLAADAANKKGGAAEAVRMRQVKK